MLQRIIFMLLFLSWNRQEVKPVILEAEFDGCFRFTIWRFADRCAVNRNVAVQLNKCLG